MFDALEFLNKVDYILLLKRYINEPLIKHTEKNNLDYLEYKKYCEDNNIKGKVMLKNWELIKLRKQYIWNE